LAGGRSSPHGSQLNLELPDAQESLITEFKPLALKPLLGKGKLIEEVSAFALCLSTCVSPLALGPNNQSAGVLIEVSFHFGHLALHSGH
jgi:hypothetical protein